MPLCQGKDYFDKVREGTAKAVILESVIAECIHVLTKIYKVPREKAAGSLIDILHYRGIVNQDQQELIRALTLYSGQNVDIVDCVLCVKAAGANASLFSFDSALNKLADAQRR